jgi:DnaJ-domain-containing protein 1
MPRWASGTRRWNGPPERAAFDARSLPPALSRMTTVLAHAKLDALVRFAVAVGVMLLGFAIARGPLALIGVVISVLGMAHAVRQFGRLAWILGLEQQQKGGASGAGASIPRRVFWLLYTVAESDGRSGAREMDLVRRFLLERFLSPEILADLTSWNAPRLPREELAPLVRSLRAQLSGSECETIFWWCCMVSLIDERFTADEHELLQDIAREFGMPGDHARRVFQHAKTRVLQATRSSGAGYSGAGGGSGRGGGFDGRSSGYGSTGGRSGSGWRRYDSGWPPRQPPQKPDRRRSALSILGLDESADERTIRKRHRELVKRYHPDAHARLGPVAAQEAAERFKEVQAAYEFLVGK